MLGLSCDKTYRKMEKYDDGDDDQKNNGRKKGRNDNHNAASGSGYDDLIFNLIIMPRSRGGVSGDNGNSSATGCALCIHASDYIYTL